MCPDGWAVKWFLEEKKINGHICGSDGRDCANSAASDLEISANVSINHSLLH